MSYLKERWEKPAVTAGRQRRQFTFRCLRKKKGKILKLSWLTRALHRSIGKKKKKKGEMLGVSSKTERRGEFSNEIRRGFCEGVPICGLPSPLKRKKG